MNYKLIYERDNGFAGSETGIPAKTDKQFDITREQLESFKLVYSKNGEVYYSKSGIPAETDKLVADYVPEKSGESVNTDNQKEPVNEPETIAEPEESISQGKEIDETDEPEEPAEAEEE